ncbi:MAG: hypothetical protein II661_09040 [Bacteroidales bacterium]|nr:hypothetical protein [Bacteroidales bacterium]
MKKSALFILVFTLGTLSINAQGIRETRIIKTTALQVYDKYISSFNSLGDQTGYGANRFLDLFAEDMDSLCNDILPNLHPAMLTPDKYVDIYSKSVRTAYRNYSNLKMGEPHSAPGNKWSIYCTFDCDIQYVDKTGLSFPSHTFSYKMHIVMDKKSSSNTSYDNAYIASLTITEPLRNYVIIHNPSGYINIKGQQQRNNANDYWIGDLGKTGISKLQSESGNPFAHTSFKAVPNQHNRYEQTSTTLDILGFGVSYAPFSLGNKLDGRFDQLSTGGNAIILHGFWGKNLSSNDYGSLFLNIGLQMFDNNHTVTGNYEVHYDDVDIDGDSYLRNITARINKETIMSFGASIPLTVSYLLAIGDPTATPLFLSVEGGVVASFKAMAIHTFDVDARYTGTYNYFGGIEFDHYYDYGDFKLNQDNAETDFSQNYNKIDVAASLGLGFWIGLTKNSFLRIDVALRKGFLSEMVYDDDYRLTSRFDDYHSAFQSSKSGAFDIFAGLSYILTLGK